MRLQQDNIFISNGVLVISFLLLFTLPVRSQPDEDPPSAPLFTILTINQLTDRTELTWDLSTSPDVAGYVVYSFRNNEGMAIDTILDPRASGFSVYWPWSLIRPESFVVAAIDYSGNISPLSNDLRTIFTEVTIDTCNRKIVAEWNNYSSYPRQVIGYDVFISVDGGNYELAGQAPESGSEFVLDDFIIDANYCFLIQARLENGHVSSSNKPCIDAEIQRSPLWINADYATISSSDEISLSFTIDPESEVDLFSLEKKTGSDETFQETARIRSVNAKVTYIDKTGDPEKTNFYRLSAVSSCNKATVKSNVASNIVLTATGTGSDIKLIWNQYRKWLGSALPYRLSMDTGNGFEEIAVFQPTDTLYSVNIPEIMYKVSGGKVCFITTAAEFSNPYGISGESVSNKACFAIEETITVPNIFSPDGDLLNDLFRPVLTFSPASYHLIITDRQRKILFESRDYTAAWDGSDKGNSVRQGVYLWFLKVITPSGRNISRTGTLTVIKNR